jgi:site-specific recombinase XerD
VPKLLDAYPAKTIFDIDTFDVEIHLAERCAGLANATRRNVLAAISSFFDYLEIRGQIPCNPCRPIKRPKLDEPEPTYWTADELTAILAAPMSVPRPRVKCSIRQPGRTSSSACFALGTVPGRRSAPKMLFSTRTPST